MMNEWINWLFILCVNAIYWLESMTGISYEAWNLILFVFLPAAFDRCLCSPLVAGAIKA
jgi:hypothetical protein